MNYLHHFTREDGLIRTWCNEVELPEQEGYLIATHKVHQIETDRYYDDAVDVPNERRVGLGLIEYHYEPTDIEVEKLEDDIIEGEQENE